MWLLWSDSQPWASSPEHSTPNWKRRGNPGDPGDPLITNLALRLMRFVGKPLYFQRWLLIELSLVVFQLVEENSTKQSPSQQASLRQKYPPEKLFTAPNAVAATGQMMDLSLAAGTLVGVIKEGDPMGNKDRWFVDTGGQCSSLVACWYHLLCLMLCSCLSAAKGFVLKSHFVPFSEAESSPKSGRSSVSSVKDLMDFSPEKSPSQSQVSAYGSSSPLLMVFLLGLVL